MQASEFGVNQARSRVPRPAAPCTAYEVIHTSHLAIVRIMQTATCALLVTRVRCLPALSFVNVQHVIAQRQMQLKRHACMVFAASALQQTN